MPTTSRWVVDVIGGTYELYISLLSGPITYNPLTDVVSLVARPVLMVSADTYIGVLRDCEDWSVHVEGVLPPIPAVVTSSCRSDVDVVLPNITDLAIKLSGVPNLDYHYQGRHVTLGARPAITCSWRAWRRLVWVIRTELDLHLKRVR